MQQADVAVRHARPITVRSVTAIPLALPLKKPMKMANAQVRTADNLLVRIEAADGCVGWGEAASAPAMTGETLDGMVAAVRDHMAPLIVGEDARLRPRMMANIAHGLYGNSGAKAAAEIALADLVGRVLGVSFAHLHGGARRSSVAPMWLIGNARIEDDIAEAHARMGDGFRFFKQKVGVKPVEAEIEAALALRKALGPDVTICADANCGFDFARAQRYLAGVAGIDLAFLEQPLPPDDLAGLARLARSQPIPLGADEGIHSLADIEAHASAGAMGVSLKLIKLGGPAGVLAAAALAQQRSLEVNIAAKVAESSLGSAASLHMACLVPRVEWGISLTHVYLGEDIAKAPLAMRDGQFTMPDGPGLGIEVDERAVARLTRN